MNSNTASAMNEATPMANLDSAGSGGATAEKKLLKPAKRNVISSMAVARIALVPEKYDDPSDSAPVVVTLSGAAA
jgi:hypothetical protein